MINRPITLYLLSFPVALMGMVQMLFALLSMLVFNDHEETQFFTPAISMLATAIFLFSVSRRFDLSNIGIRDALLFAVLT